MTFESRPGRRTGGGRNLSTSAHASGGAAFDDDDLGGGGPAAVDEALDGFHQPTAMFDKGQFLGELADLVDGSPDTRAQIEAAEQGPPKGCRLIVVAGPDIGLAWSFKAGEVVIGRDEGCALALSDIAVSRRHARILLDGGGFFIEDLGSNNGTFLNGDRVEGRRGLVAGDEVVIGERTLRFVELNEAPSTEAAHPVPGLGVDLEDAPFEQAGISQIGARIPDREPVPVVTPVPPEEGRGVALRRLLRGAGALGLAMVLLGGGIAMLVHRQAVRRAEAREREARTRFLESVALVQAERFGDAKLVLGRLRALDPSHPRLDAYLAHVDRELEQWGILEAARERARKGRYVEAIELLGAVEAESAYADEAARRTRAYERQIARGLLEDARAKLAANELDAAVSLVEKALDRDPASRSARLVLDELEAARTGRGPALAPRRPLQIPPVLARAMMLYREGRIAAAIDAAEASGAPEAREATERMTTMKGLLTEAALLHRRKEGAALLEVVPRALALDERIGSGEGEVRSALIGYFADGLYLTAIEALQDRDEPKAFALLAEALRKKPDHGLAKTRLVELEARAKELFYEARVLEESDPKAARDLYERLTRMTHPSNAYHKLAKRHLRGG